MLNLSIMKTVISLKGLTKKYGKTTAVNKLDIQVEAGEIHGFVGPNGAGKTTTIKLILNLIKPSAGQIKIMGQDVNFGDISYLPNIGFLSSDEELPTNSTANQLLKLTANLNKLNKQFISQLIEAFELEGLLDTKLKQLSRGNQRKISVLLALCSDAKVLILDEPTEGLDPLMQERFYKILINRAKNGSTIFFSSHNLAEVQKICTKISFIKKGSIVRTAKIDELGGISIKKIELHFSSVPDEAAISLIKRLAVNSEFSKINSKAYILKFSGDYTELLQNLAKLKLTNLNIQDVDLESIFLKMYSEVK